MKMNNVDPQKMNALLNVVGNKLNMSPEQLRKELEAGKFDSAINNMKPAEAEKFNAVMKNPKLLDSIMSTPQAQELYRKLTGGKK
ncbi:MAG: hypothetical protein ACI4XF_07310 [Oscillospiraceae bacterium]